VLAFFCEEGPHLRQLASDTVRGLYANPLMTVVPQSHQSFLAGLALYQARPDKGYSLTDCISMNVMRHEGITEILTHDNHFTQEGFHHPALSGSTTNVRNPAGTKFMAAWK
jgi:uncharacterized protein